MNAIAGAKGDTGAPGAPGTNGLSGANGINGVNGVNGTPGIQGVKGDTGATGTIQAGTAKGQMLYWDGNTSWLVVPPVGGQNAILKFCDGVPTWVIASCYVKIGDRGSAGGAE
jgi:hypothetical protein